MIRARARARIGLGLGRARARARARIRLGLGLGRARARARIGLGLGRARARIGLGLGLGRARARIGLGIGLVLRMIRARARVTLTSITALFDDLVRELDVQGVHSRGYFLTDASQVRQHTGTIVLLQFPQDVLHLKTTHYNVRM